MDLKLFNPRPNDRGIQFLGQSCTALGSCPLMINWTFNNIFSWSWALKSSSPTYLSRKDSTFYKGFLEGKKKKTLKEKYKKRAVPRVCEIY